MNRGRRIPKRVWKGMAKQVKKKSGELEGTKGKRKKKYFKKVIKVMGNTYLQKINDTKIKNKKQDQFPLLLKARRYKSISFSHTETLTCAYTHTHTDFKSANNKLCSSKIHQVCCLIFLLLPLPSFVVALQLTCSPHQNKGKKCRGWGRGGGEGGETWWITEFSDQGLIHFSGTQILAVVWKHPNGSHLLSFKCKF